MKPDKKQQVRKESENPGTLLSVFNV